ncbi:MAG: GNAT family N-acetyltransferase [Nanoarchaeota archaeon]|nr:GNAT family N-acetyltransferase [Nanoarchaeota archaeon]MBU4452152.1 GNAT family N-acetyltransferase [Nanoarchaeota archaeon]MCG2724285.1 GNAT family N-acetyltransferase [archaeon]
MNIRNATRLDVIACARIQRATESSRMEYSRKAEMLTRKYLQRYLSNDYSTFLVAEDGNETMGHIVFSYDEWNNSIHIDLLFIRPNRQNQGIGSKLIDAVVERVKKQGARIIFLETNKMENDAIKFYKKNGFRVAGHINGMYNEARGDAIVMSKALNKKN